MPRDPKDPRGPHDPEDPRDPHDPRDPRDLRALPKAHLHLHVVGALRRSTFAELATERFGAAVEIPAAGRTFDSFTHFQSVIDQAVAVLRTPEAVDRVVREIVASAAADGAVWVEPSLEPGLIGPEPRGSGDAASNPRDEAIEVALAAGRAEAAARGIGFGLVVAANRTHGPVAAIRTARLAISLADKGVVAFGLDGDEVRHPAQEFGEAYRIARDGGLLAAPHAGELTGPESVAAALDVLGANRVMHGVRAVEDPALVARLADSEVTLDVCPTSNVALRVVPSMAAHPLPRLLAAGVRCSLAADDPLLFGSDLLGEYATARTALELDDTALARIADASLRGSGAPADLIRAARTGVAAWLGET